VVLAPKSTKFTIVASSVVAYRGGGVTLPPTGGSQLVCHFEQTVPLTDIDGFTGRLKGGCPALLGISRHRSLLFRRVAAAQEGPAAILALAASSGCVCLSFGQDLFHSENRSNRNLPGNLPAKSV
jgi:hypothetical protein